MSEFDPQDPQPGIYLGVPNDVYHSTTVRVATNSRLKKFLSKSPLHCWNSVESPSEQTEAMVVGEALHTRILEPDTFDSRFTTSQRCMGQTKGGVQCKNGGSICRLMPGGPRWFCSRHAQEGAPLDRRAVLTADNLELVDEMADSLRRHDAAQKILGLPGDREVTLVADHKPSGQRVMCRIDVWCRDASIMADLKTTRDASRDQFERALANFGYAQQAALYGWLTSACGEATDDFVFLAVEKEDPYAVGVYRVVDDAKNEEWRKVEAGLVRYAECVQSGEWPGYGDGIQDIDLPSWAYKRM